MRSKWASWEPGTVSLKPRTRFEVLRRAPRSFAPVPTKHFGVLLGHILEEFGDYSNVNRWRLFQIYFWVGNLIENDEFWYQIQTDERWYFTASSEIRKVDFWTTVHAFSRILVFSEIHWSLIVEAKKLVWYILTQIWIWNWFWSDFGTTLCPKSGSKSMQNRVWMPPCFWDLFWTLLVEPESKWWPRKWHFRGGYEGTKGGSNIVTRLSSPISWGRRICMYIYIYIFMYTYTHTHTC